MGPRAKNFHTKNSSEIYATMVIQEKASGNHGARENADTFNAKKIQNEKHHDSIGTADAPIRRPRRGKPQRR